MQKISDGYFYDVYDLDNGKVLKKKRSFDNIANSIKGKNDINIISNWFKTFKYIRQAERVTEIVRTKIVALPQELIGNPQFINKVDYEQDKVVLLMDYFKNHSFEENKIVADKYVELIKTFLKFEMHDYVYKFKNSYGVNNSGNVVLIDFNEITFSKEKTLEFVAKKQWQNEAQFRKFEEGELKEYLRQKLEETLKPEIIEDLWGKNLIAK